MAWIRSLTLLAACACLPPLSTGGCATEPRVTDNPTAAMTAADGQGPRLVNAEWRIIKMATAHGDLVIEVEAADRAEAATIARALTEPLKDRYDEVLVYVRGLGDKPELPPRRVHWTREHGYVDMSDDEN